MAPLELQLGCLIEILVLRRLARVYSDGQALMPRPLVCKRGVEGSLHLCHGLLFWLIFLSDESLIDHGHPGVLQNG